MSAFQITDAQVTITRNRRLVDTMERLLEGEVYHYYHKMTMKAPYVGSAWEWHQNWSPDPRWRFLACYNAARNDPYKDSGHPRYSPLQKAEDSAIKAAGHRQWQDMQTAAAV